MGGWQGLQVQLSAQTLGASPPARLTLAVSSCTAMKFKNVVFTGSGPATTVMSFSSSRTSGPPKPSTSRILGSWGGEGRG